jgi:hypothetical protein
MTGIGPSSRQAAQDRVTAVCVVMATGKPATRSRSGEVERAREALRQADRQAHWRRAAVALASAARARDVQRSSPDSRPDPITSQSLGRRNGSQW